MLKTFMDVNLESFIPDTTTGLDIYIRRGTDFLLYRKGELPFTVENQQKLLEGGHRTVYIASEDREKYLAYMESNISRIVADPRFSMEKKTRIVYETSTLPLPRPTLGDGGRTVRFRLEIGRAHV